MARHRRALGRRGRRSAATPEVWLYSLFHPRCLQGEDGWTDPFFGDLDELLSQNGVDVGRLLPLAHIGDTAALDGRMRYLRPQASGITLTGLVRAVLSVWVPSWPRAAQIDGLDVGPLLRRAWWQDLSRAVGPAAYLFKSSMDQVFRSRAVSCVVFPYENQTWERMLIMSAREAGVRTVGYQHSTVPHLSLNYFFGRQGVGSAPIPDAVLTTGKYYQETLITGGLPVERVSVGGAWRYRHLQGRVREGHSVQRSPRKVLVVTAHQLDAVRELDKALRRSFPDGGRAASIDFWFRPHPTLLQRDDGVGSWMTILEGGSADRLVEFDAIVCLGTTVAIETFLMGLTVLRFLPEVAMDLDPADIFPETSVPTADSESLGDRLQALLDNPLHVDAAERQRWSDTLFHPVDRQVWLDAILGV